MWKRRRGTGVFLHALEVVLTVAGPTGRMLNTSKEAAWKWLGGDTGYLERST
jgi:hypothetical protein